MLGFSTWSRGVAALLLVAAATLQGAAAQGKGGPDFYKISTPEEIKQSARDLAWHVMVMYPGNQTGQEVGILPGPPADGKGPYYWWQAGAMWGAMIDYWHYVGDDTYNKLVTDGIMNQIGEDKDFEPKRHVASLGNDDQAFWAMTTMLAAESKFPDPPGAGKENPGWLALSQAVWVRQAMPERHDDKCGGGMRWQVPDAGWSAGYDYKNTIANACFFNLGARLTRYTGNTTYSDFAEKIWDWMWDHNYIDHDNWKVYDGARVGDNCTDVSKQQFSYNIGVLLQGAAFMWNRTSQDKWKTAVKGLTQSIIRDFFSDGALVEIACEPVGPGKCSQDMLMFKGFVHRWLAQVTQLAPYVREDLLPVLRKSTAQALKTCTGPPDGRVCGFYWTKGVYNDPALEKDVTGVGARLDAMSAVVALLVESEGAPPPVTQQTGGDSVGDKDAGLRHTPIRAWEPITTGDRAGAAILTTVLVGGALSMFGWISWD